ncbi:MAG: ACP S-malonyltransferase [Holosporaceae bacterium]|nr:MAG: ACP S-malonyltransferase [Holosporaceae bacterium]
MGRDLYEAFPVVQRVFEELDDTLSLKAFKSYFEGPIEELSMTENTQPALVAVSIAAFRVLEHMGVKKHDFSFMAGHSLGEYAALCASGVVSFADTVLLLRERGKAMQRAVPLGEGGMVALIGADIETAEKLASEASQAGICEVANDNCPGQIVVSGQKVAMEKVVEISGNYGIKRALPLNVSAPFHSSMMRAAADHMASVLAEVPFHKADVPILPNVSVRPETDGNTLKKLLVAQITGRVRWSETVRFLIDEQVSKMLEVGAGKVLCGLVKRTSDQVPCMPLGDP